MNVMSNFKWYQLLSIVKQWAKGWITDSSTTASILWPGECLEEQAPLPIAQPQQQVPLIHCLMLPQGSCLFLSKCRAIGPLCSVQQWRRCDCCPKCLAGVPGGAVKTQHRRLPPRQFKGVRLLQWRMLIIWCALIGWRVALIGSACNSHENR